MRTISKTIARDRPDGSYIEITAEERAPGGTLSPGFSITGALWDSRPDAGGRARKQLGRDSDAGGRIHEEILAAVPALEPLIVVHNADQDGIPMYAKANGWYFYSGKASSHDREQIARGHDYGYSRLLESSDHDRAAEALCIDPAQLPTDLGTQERFDAFVDSLSKLYAHRAAVARAVLSSLTDGERVEPVGG